MSAIPFIQNESEFDSLLQEESLFVVDFTAPWCGPCKVVAPLMDKLSEDYSEHLKVFKLDLDENGSLAKRFNIKSIPAVIFFKAGERVETLVGVKPYDVFTQTVDRLI